MVVLETAAIIGLVGWVAAPVITRLIGKVDSYVAKKYKWRRGLQEKLESLGPLLDEIGSTVSLVEAGRMNNHNMVCWHSQLKGAIDEVMDIFDLLDRDIVESNNKIIQQQDADKASTAASVGSDESLKRLRKLVEKLKEIRQSSRDLVQASMLAVTMAAGCSNDDSWSGGTSRPVTGPLLPSDPVGYEKEYKDLLAALLAPDKIIPQEYGSSEAVVAIIGHGGMGKTTLAQRAWNDPVVKARFPVLIWASVYNKFSEADLLGEIWRSSSVQRRHGEMRSFGTIQQELEELVASSKRYLLVLDDVCNDETATHLQRRDAWSHVLAPFLRTAQQPPGGSRVLVTTRAMICAQTLGAGTRITLDGVDRESYIKLLKRNAASAAGSKDMIRASDLDEVLRRSSTLLISEEAKWKRSPLSAKEIGLKLRNIRSKNTWAEILRTDCHEDVISAHMSSYLPLPPHLQHCLAFLGLFPNNFKFRPEMLIKMWVAHGFISDDGGNAMEETAERYFNDLLLRSFLQTVKKGDTDYYVIHEQIHSMIRSVSANYFMMIRSVPAKIPLTVRHLSVTTSCLPQLKINPSVLKKLRTFLVLRDSSPAITAIDKDLLTELKGIRVMDLTGIDVASLPPEIGSLIHLRFLALPNTIHKLPEEFSKLYHLQTPIGSNHAQTVPEVHDPINLDLAFKFRAYKKTSLEQLARMDSLRGSLEITGLDVVATKEDAQKGHLKNKKSLRVLKFCWDDAVAISTSDLDVLEGLEPHSGLQELHIRRYRGTSSPCWFTNNCLNQLTHIYIINCRQWKDLPSFGHLPHLNHLQITEVESVIKIDGNGLFKSLETLVLVDLESLVEWTTGATNSRFPTLKMVKIEDCPRFNKPPPFQSASIGIKGCPHLTKHGTTIVPIHATS